MGKKSKAKGKRGGRSNSNKQGGGQLNGAKRKQKLRHDKRTGREGSPPPQSPEHPIGGTDASLVRRHPETPPGSPTPTRDRNRAVSARPPSGPSGTGPPAEPWDPRRELATRGLANLGNTCFFNSALQNLFKARLLHEALFAHPDRRHGPYMGPMNKAFRRSMLEMMGDGAAEKRGQRAYSPTVLLSQIRKAHPSFKGSRQQDAHELFMRLLDTLEDEEDSYIRRSLEEEAERRTEQGSEETTDKTPKTRARDGGGGGSGSRSRSDDRREVIKALADISPDSAGSSEEAWDGESPRRSASAAAALLAEQEPQGDEASATAATPTETAAAAVALLQGIHPSVPAPPSPSPEDPGRSSCSTSNPDDVTSPDSSVSGRGSLCDVTTAPSKTLVHGGTKADLESGWHRAPTPVTEDDGQTTEEGDPREADDAGDEGGGLDSCGNTGDAAAVTGGGADGVEAVGSGGGRGEVGGGKPRDSMALRRRAAVTEVFGGSLCSVVTCQSCRARSFSTEPTICLSLVIPSRSSGSHGRGGAEAGRGSMASGSRKGDGKPKDRRAKALMASAARPKGLELSAKERRKLARMERERSRLKEPSAAGDAEGDAADEEDRDGDEVAPGASKATVTPSAREEYDEVRRCLESIVALVADSARDGEGLGVAMGAKVEDRSVVEPGVPVEADQEVARAPPEQPERDAVPPGSECTRVNPEAAVDGAAPGSSREDSRSVAESEAVLKDECPTTHVALESVETVVDAGSPSEQTRGSGRRGESHTVEAGSDSGEPQAPEPALTRDATHCRVTGDDLLESGRSEHDGLCSGNAACVAPASGPRGKDVVGPGELMQSEHGASLGEACATEGVGEDGDSSGRDDAKPTGEGSDRSSRAPEAAAPLAERKPESPFSNLVEPPARVVDSGRVRDSSAIDLYACLDHFMAEEELVAAEGNGYDCEGCRSRGREVPTAEPDEDEGDSSDGVEASGARKEEPRRILRDARKRLLMVGEPPGVLVCHLKRLQAQKKIQTRVDFPEELDMCSYFWRDLEAPLPASATLYRLFGLVEHRGNRFGGHYVAYVREAGGWKHASDLDVRPACIAEVKRSNAYMLFYERIDKDPTSRADAIERAALAVRDDELVTAAEETDENPSHPGEREANSSDAQERVSEDTMEKRGDVTVGEEGDGLSTSPDAHAATGTSWIGYVEESPPEVAGEDRDVAAVHAEVPENLTPHDEAGVANGSAGDTAVDLRSSSGAQDESTLTGSLVNGVLQPSVTAMNSGPSVDVADESCATVHVVAVGSPGGEEAKPSMTEMEPSTKPEKTPEGGRRESSDGSGGDEQALGLGVAEGARVGARVLVAVPSVLGSKERDAVEGMCALETEALGVKSLPASRSLAVEPLQ